MNPFINAQGYSTTGMFSVVIGAVANIILDLLFYFYVRARSKRCRYCNRNIPSDIIRSICFYFLRRKAELKVRLLRKTELHSCLSIAKNIITLGIVRVLLCSLRTVSFQFAANVIYVTGGDVYVSVMTYRFKCPPNG